MAGSWRLLLVAAAAMVGTLPGRTQGLGLVTEPLLADMRLDRVSYAELNFWATIVGSAGAIGIGPLVDRFGSRRMLALVALALGLVVSAMSQATSFVALALWVTLTRALGQSALSVVSLAMIGQWFVERIDVAMALYSVAMSVGFMIAFPVVGSLVQSRGWRFAWLSIGVALIVVLAPLALIVPRTSSGRLKPAPTAEIEQKLAPIAENEQKPAPTAENEQKLAPTAENELKPAPTSDVGSGRASEVDPGGGRLQAARGYLWHEALLTPAFWIFAIGTALYGLVASGIGLFNESILAQRGFGPQVYYQTLVVTAMTALAGNFGGGWLATRMAPGRLMAIALFVLTAGLLALPHLSTYGHVMGWATAMGLGGGLVMVLFFSVWARVFGRLHLGRIQGAAQALTVVASALGPLLLAWCVEWTGSYAAMFRILAAVIAVVSIAALVAPLPVPRGDAAATASPKRSEGG